MNILYILFLVNINKKIQNIRVFDDKNLKDFEGIDTRNVTEHKYNDYQYMKHHIDFLLNKNININYKLEFIYNFSDLRKGGLFKDYEEFL